MSQPKETIMVQLETHIIAIWILNQGEGIVSNFGHKLLTLELRSMIDAPLKDTAAMTMGSNFDTVGRDSVINELVVS
jgi:hypothetical protein